MEVQIDPGDSVLTAHVSGNITEREARTLVESVIEKLDENQDLLMDLEKAEYLGSSGISSIAILYQVLSERKRAVAVYAGPNVINLYLKPSGIMEVVSVFEVKEEALAYLQDARSKRK